MEGIGSDEASVHFPWWCSHQMFRRWLPLPKWTPDVQVLNFNWSFYSKRLQSNLFFKTFVPPVNNNKTPKREPQTVCSCQRPLHPAEISVGLSVAATVSCHWSEKDTNPEENFQHRCNGKSSSELSTLTGSSCAWRPQNNWNQFSVDRAKKRVGQRTAFAAFASWPSSSITPLLLKATTFIPRFLVNFKCLTCTNIYTTQDNNESPHAFVCEPSQSLKMYTLK